MAISLALSNTGVIAAKSSSRAAQPEMRLEELAEVHTRRDADRV